MADLTQTQQIVSSTIKTDAHTYRWFAYLLFKPQVKKELTADANIKANYTHIKHIILGQALLNLIIAIFIVFVNVSGVYSYYWLGIVFLFPIFKLHWSKKANIIKIAQKLISGDYNQLSLYQLCEVLSKKFSIPSLVSTIYYLDTILVITIVGFLVIKNFIWPIYTDLQYDTVLVITYLCVKSISKFSFIYKHLS